MTSMATKRSQDTTGDTHERILRRTSRIVEHSKQLAALNTIASSVSQSLDFHQTLTTAVQLVPQLMEFEAGMIFLTDKPAQGLKLSAHHGLSPALLSLIDRVEPGEAIIDPVIRNGEPLIGPIPQKDAGTVGQHLWREGFWFFVTIPLKAKGNTKGVMVLTSHGPRHVTDDSSQFLVSVGDVIGVAIENASLYQNIAELLDETRCQAERLQQSQRQFQVVAELGQRALAGVELSTLIDEAVALTAGTLEVEYSNVLELLPDGGALRLRAGVGWAEHLVGQATVPTDHNSQAGYTLQSNEPVILEDLSRETRFSGPVLLKQGVVSGISVVIPGRDRPFGVLGAHATKRRVFTRDDIHFLQGVANVLAEAIERKRTEGELAAGKERLAVTLRSIGEGVITTDTEGSIILMNKVAEALTGRTQDEAVGKPLGDIYQIVNPKTGQHCENAAQRALKTGRLVGSANPTTLIARDGSEKLITDSGAPLHAQDGKIIGVVLVFRDISEQQKIEEELLNAQRLESIGTLAGGIAHDFNNILTSIMGNLSLAKMQIEPGSKVYDRLKAAETASLRAKDLTQQLLTFSKGGAPIKKTASIPEIIKDSANFVLRGSNSRCQFSFADNLYPAEVDESQISQVIQNLIMNSIQAMPDGGIIQVRAENLNLGPGHDLPLEVGRYLKIVIEDGGSGIPEEYLSKIFDPYFTTKQKGHGLGLTTAYSIIRKHDGHIATTSLLGAGTTCTIYLPASEKETGQQIGTQDRSLVSQGRIMVMDDEKMIRELTGHILEGFGYEVEFAKDGREAIEKYVHAREVGRPIDVVLMDLTIPGGMGGKETMKRLLEIDPDTKAIVSSGYSNDPVMAHFRKYGFRGFVAKPYRIEDLGQSLYQVLHDSESDS